MISNVLDQWTESFFVGLIFDNHSLYLEVENPSCILWQGTFSLNQPSLEWISWAVLSVVYDFEGDRYI
jgi:hypothetical protein